MKYLFLTVVICIGFLFSCKNTVKQPVTRIAKGGKVYGGNFRFMSAEKVNSLLPSSSADQYSSRIVSQLFEPLLKISLTSGEIVPSLAEEFWINDKGDVYTFRLRKNVFFHQDIAFDGLKTELTAEDVKFSLELACSGLELNSVGFNLINKIKGAKEFNQLTSKSIGDHSVSGIKIVNRHTVEITLNEPLVGFDKVLAQPSLGILSKQAFNFHKEESINHPVGTGPYKLNSFDDEKITLVRNELYWAKDELGNPLPFIDSVTMTYIDGKKDELLAFRKENIDVVFEIPVDEIEHVLGTLTEAQEGKNLKHKVESAPSLNIRYIGFNSQTEVFQNRDIRKAFNIAVDRVHLIDNKLEGEGLAAQHGFVPNYEGYDNSKIKGHEFNIQKANQLINQSGFKGKIPTLKFFVNGKKGTLVDKLSRGVAEQITENLGVNIEIVLCTLVERDQAINSGKADLWIAGWVADYLDAENFLALFYSKNTQLNQFNYSNEAYDEQFEKILTLKSPMSREEAELTCDQMIIDDAVVIPIMTEMNTILINARVRKFNPSPMEALNLTDVYIKNLRRK